MSHSNTNTFEQIYTASHDYVIKEFLCNNQLVKLTKKDYYKQFHFGLVNKEGTLINASIELIKDNLIDNTEENIVAVLQAIEKYRKHDLLNNVQILLKNTIKQ